MKYSLGYKKNPIRNLPKFEVSDILLPLKTFTDIHMIPVLDQGQQPACVGHAFATALMYDYYKKTGKVSLISPRFIYSQAKLLDGDPNGEGTSAYFAFQGVKKLGGSATIQTVPNDVTMSLTDYQTVIITDSVTQECHEYPIKTEIEIQNPTDQQLKTLLNQYGMVIVAGSVDENSWMIQDGMVSLLPGNAGDHEFTLFGYDMTVGTSTQYDMRNSWGGLWANHGNSNFFWSDYQNNIFDAMVITIDMENQIFSRTLQKGCTGSDVAKLQTILGINSDGIFGPKTEVEVMLFQTLHDLDPDGICGPKTEAILETLNIQKLTEPINVTIERSISDKKETLGILTIENSDFVCKTLEPANPIPKGIYQCIWSFQKDLNEYHYEVQNVPGHTSIFIHEGNYYSDTEGCILLGLTEEDINSDGELDVTSSRATLEQFQTLTNKMPLILTIS